MFRFLGLSNFTAVTRGRAEDDLLELLKDSISLEGEGQEGPGPQSMRPWYFWCGFFSNKQYAPSLNNGKTTPLIRIDIREDSLDLLRIIELLGGGAGCVCVCNSRYQSNQGLARLSGSVNFVQNVAEEVSIPPACWTLPVWLNQRHFSDTTSWCYKGCTWHKIRDLPIFH